MLESLQQLHSIGLIHQDVKPDNFRIQDKKVLILDFGLVSSYLTDGVHKGLEQHGFQGTPHFGSISGLKKFTLSRRDDIESLGYCIMFLIERHTIPWINAQDMSQILTLKEEFLASESVPIYFKGIQAFIRYAASIGYDEDPDYEELKRLISQLFEAQVKQF